MSKKSIVGLMILALLVSFTLPAVAQETTVKGNLSGTVYDSTGAVVPGAKITLSGAMGVKSTDSDNEGHFIFPLLVPGFYSVRVEKQGFKASDVKGIEIATNKTTAIRVTVEPGAVSETVEVSAPAVTVDTSTTTVSTNMTDSFYSQVPVPRNVTGLFYLAPGAVSGGNQVTQGNPSISGGSALENQYVADGVSITDGAFGGVGVWSRIYGSLTTGINLSFVQEVQVKSGGYEPQYGKATGGIVQIVTKSGGNKYHGQVAGYFAPEAFEASRYQADLGGPGFANPRFNQQGQVLHQANFDIDGEIGGYVPGFKDKLFFFGSFDPTWNRDYVVFSPLQGIAPTPGSPVGGLGPATIKSTNYNYAGKLTWKISSNHSLEGSVFGDPTRTPAQPATTGATFLNTNSPTTFDQMAFGTRNVVVRYNGTFSPTWLVNASLSWGHNYLTDTAVDPSIYGITNNTMVNPSPANCQLTGTCLTTGAYVMQGYGFAENTQGDNYGFEIDTQKTFHFLGDHSFSLGYKLDRSLYKGTRDRTGGFSAFPTTNSWGENAADIYGPAAGAIAGSALGMDFGGQLRIGDFCTSCPVLTLPNGVTHHVYLLQTRGEFGPPVFDTAGTYHAIYGMDSWSPWKYLTINAGLRWEQQYMQGTYNPLIAGTTTYTWVGNWSPRIGVTVDPWGDRKTKIYVNFGRYNYAIPLDMAIRSLSNEQDVYTQAWAPHWVGEVPGVPCANALLATTCNAQVALNPDGTLVNPTFDAQHFIMDPNGIYGGFPSGGSYGLSSTESIAPGTKMESLDEWVVGFDRDMGHGVIFSARYIDRRMKRIVEDMSGISPEAANLGVVQNFIISNPNSKTDLFVNPTQIENWTPQFTATGGILNVSGYNYTGGPNVGLPCNPDPNPANLCNVNNAGAITQLVPSGCFSSFNPATGFNAAGTGPASVPFVGQVLNTFGQVVLPGGSVAPSAVNTGLCVLPQTSWTGTVNYIGGHQPGDLTPDGIPEGFVNPIRNYQAIEFEVNKSFSKNWQLAANWRIAKLKGNYEGAFRNDNGQSDPSISSLFDFTAGDYFLLGDQFANGYLNTDRRHVINTQFSYLFDRYFLKGLTIGTALRVQTGAPINDLKAHPVYQNSGEVPVGGRGALGRFPTTGQVDLHLDYAFKVTEKSNLHFGVDMFNIANMKRVTNIDQNEDRSYGVPNVDFKNITGIYSGFQRPFYARAMVKWEF